MGSERYARHLALAEVGAAGQARLGATRVLVIGLGGLGCPAAQYLASSGVGTLVLNDFDRVDETNLPRQILFSDQDVGEFKVEAAGRRLSALNSAVAISCLASRLNADDLKAAVKGVDIVLDCTDNFATRLMINEACVAAAVPLVSGAALRFEGQLAVFENRADEPCYRCLYSDEDELLGDCQGNGVLAPVPGVIGTLMATEALQIAIHRHSALNGRLQLWDAKAGVWQSLAIARDPECPVCSQRP